MATLRESLRSTQEEMKILHAKLDIEDIGTTKQKEFKNASSDLTQKTDDYDILEKRLVELKKLIDGHVKVS